jgi:signal transduction histidine kinase
LGSDFVGAILKDRSGGLWIGTFHGLSRFAGGKFTNYTRQNGLSHDVITALHQDGAGALWIGTNGGGLNRFKDGKFFSYRSPLGLPDVLYGMLEDSGQNLWISSNKGVFRVSKQNLDDVADGKKNALEVISYGVADGMKISECSSGGHPAVCRSRNGALWFSTLKGVSVLDPQRVHLNLLPPKVAIELVSVDDQIFDPSQATDVASGHSRFSFQYAGLSFVAPQKVRFKYKLEGFDREWIDAGARRIAYYTNIPPGRYRFTVQASNNDGIWNEGGATFAFRLRPRFYQTYWFYALVAIALGLIGYQVYRLRLRQVESQFQAVLAERNRIGREIHDTLAQGFVGISVHLELVGRFMSTSVDIAKEHLQLARALAQDSLAEARRSIWNLRSQGSSSEDFASRLTQMAHQATASTAIKVQFQVGGVYRPLPQNVEAELLRIGQEAVTNAVRHSSAKHIDIDVKFETKRVQMTIEDDGCGFTGQPNHSGPDGHFGLVGMKERAHQINSQLKVESTLGVGTRVSVETPIN